MFKIVCDECRKPLDAPPLIQIQEILFLDPQGNRGAKGLHFCDMKCLTSSLTKLANKPNLVLPNAN